MKKEFKMSQSRFDELQKELTYLKTTRSDEVAEMIKVARGFGDLSENSEYDEAKNEQGKLYSRISELENVLLHAVIIEEGDMPTGQVTIGSTVTVTAASGGASRSFKIVGSQEADFPNGAISEESPVGKALMGAQAGQTVVVEAPRLIVSPLNGEVVTVFSVDQLVYNETLADWRTHDGIDISAVQGTTVLAASSGTVSSVTDDPLMGTTVVINHDGGYQTTYSNLQARPNVEAGETVSAGQIIGAVGRTAAAESAQGPHLHFSVTKDGVPVDPSEYLKR